MRLKWNARKPLLAKLLGARAAALFAFSLLFSGCLNYEKASLSGSSTNTATVPTSTTSCSSNQSPDPKVVFLDPKQLSIGGSGLKCVDNIILTGPGNSNTIIARFDQISINRSGTYLTASPFATIGNIVQLTAGATYKLLISDANAASVVSTIQVSAISGPVVIGSGNLGIGTTNPLRSLEVKGVTAGEIAYFNDATGNGRSLKLTTEQGGGGASLGITNNGQYWDFGVNSSGAAFIAPSGGTAMTLNTAGLLTLSGGITTGTGNVGIGTTAPLSKLHVAGTGTQATWISASDSTASTGTTGYFNTLYSGASSDPSPAHIWSQGTDLRFGTWGSVNGGLAWQEKIRITSGGYLGVGTTTPATALQVNGTITANAIAGLPNSLPNSNSGNGYQTLPGGLILQFGYAPSPGSGNTTVTFPIAFPNYVYNFTAIPTYPGTPQGPVVIYSLSLSGASFDSDSNGTKVAVYWMAIGK